MNIEVRTGKLEEVLDLQKEIPELENPYTRTAYEHRLAAFDTIILIAEIAQIPIGFKVGYDRFKNRKTFYSWMGSVHPAYRKMGVAKLLLQKMEVWCRIKGYQKLQFKTMNKHRAMRRFAINNGFDVIDFKPENDISNSKIYYEKDL